MKGLKSLLDDEIYCDHFENGQYLCAKCNTPLFDSSDKFRSTTPNPAFRRAIDLAVATFVDTSLGLERTGVACASCSEPIGHLFRDAKRVGDADPNAELRFCINSAGLFFEPRQ